MVAALDANGMGREHGLLELPVRAVADCSELSLFEIASFPAHAELIVWSCPVLMVNISKHKRFRGRKHSEGWVGCGSPPSSAPSSSHQGLNISK